MDVSGKSLYIKVNYKRDTLLWKVFLHMGANSWSRKQRSYSEDREGTVISIYDFSYNWTDQQGTYNSSHPVSQNAPSLLFYTAL